MNEQELRLAATALGLMRLRANRLVSVALGQGRPELADQHRDDAKRCKALCAKLAAKAADIAATDIADHLL
jgi:hypothetical protein